MKKILIILIVLVSFSYGSGAYAGVNQVDFSLNKEEVGIGEEFLLSVDIGSESANAVEGSVIFPSGYVEFVDIREGGSVINFWVEKPHLEKDGSIFFSGITAQGFSGQNHLFTIVFKSKKPGNVRFSFEDVKVLKNDGQGTKLGTLTTIATININEGAGDDKKETYNDYEPPEIFAPVVGSDPAIFEGKNFIVFSTVDKISGIDHYEVREGRFGRYKIADSPHELSNQKLSSKIYIKAVDKAGNERVVSFSPQGKAWYEKYYLFAIIILLIIVFTFRRKLWQKFIK